MTCRPLWTLVQHVYHIIIAFSSWNFLVNWEISLKFMLKQVQYAHFPYVVMLYSSCPHLVSLFQPLCIAALLITLLSSRRSSCELESCTSCPCLITASSVREGPGAVTSLIYWNNFPFWTLKSSNPSKVSLLLINSASLAQLTTFLCSQIARISSVAVDRDARSWRHLNCLMFDDGLPA